ncbi:hypothetical protein ACFPIJ_36815 [Dactylosporangium cerinum]|uniref:Leucine-rich repeat domain-containing protein n=1 Tax=Dactylosporangium cerinum TaxID=1434730 RepID=A0ABV9W620_9ACTN
MDRDEFAARFAASAAAARAVALPMVIEPLPEPLLFRVRLNQSYDGNPPAPGERRYPQDGSMERAVALHRCDAETAIAELWRDGHVPQWINVAVVGETGDATVVELVCCGRFDPSPQGPVKLPPFNVGGPTMGFGRDEVPFNIHAVAECWDSADLRRLAIMPDVVRSLTLMTGDLDTTLPALPNLEMLEHGMWTLGDLSVFAHFPKLWILRLHAPGIVRVVGAVPASVRGLTITAGELGGSAALPGELDSLDLHLARGTDRDVERLLEGVSALRYLDLSGTPVTDAIIPALDRLDLAVLDLRRTAVSDEALARFREERPGVRLHPYVPPPGYVPPPSGYENVQLRLADFS